MKVSNSSWAERLTGKIPESLAREIDIFETEITLRKQGKIDERLFAETRLRRGVYGQRYDNGQRHNGKTVQQLGYPSGELTKGPNTMWDAPGMQRIKIPAGGLNAEQLETLAELSEEYSDGIAHVTTRQDFQLHYVHIEDTPSLMRRLAAAQITTREACGNSVRNVTACPYAGVCPDEVFDVTPYSKALSKFLLGHPDCQNFGRKFKPSFSGCSQHACGLARMHDLGMIAVTRTENGKEKRGFETYVGGGLGAVPYQAKLFDTFVPPEELLPLAQAIARVFAARGEKKNRSRARIKFLIQDLGIEKFKELVLEERKNLPPDPRWTEFVKDADEFQETPLRPGGKAPLLGTESFQRWVKFNTRPQKQDGYVVVTIALPLGDIAANQLRSLADIARRFTMETIRTTVEQNIVLRWVSKSDLLDLHKALDAAGLAMPGAESIMDVAACPGTDTCKLGISSSRGLAAELRNRMGKVELKKMLEDLARLPADPSDRSFFSDWGDPREYSLSDMGIGECAGEVVSAVEFDLAAAERELFEAQVKWESGQVEEAGATAYKSMLRAAKALVKVETQNVTDDPGQIVREFRARYYDTQKFFDPFAGGKFANYLFAAHEKSNEPYTFDSTRYLIDEAQLFIDAAHSCYNRVGTPASA